MRIIIYLPERDLEQLAELCRQEHISRAEAVRRAVSRYLKEAGRQAGGAAFGIWATKRQDGLKYQEKLRREWERRGEE